MGIASVRQTKLVPLLREARVPITAVAMISAAPLRVETIQRNPGKIEARKAIRGQIISDFLPQRSDKAPPTRVNTSPHAPQVTVAAKATPWPMCRKATA